MMVIFFTHGKTIINLIFECYRISQDFSTEPKTKERNHTELQRNKQMRTEYDTLFHVFIKKSCQEIFLLISFTFLYIVFSIVCKM